jgi:ABC-2 type transport system permease protein
MLLRNLRFIWLRMCRAYVVFILLLVVPLCVIVVWGVAVGSVITADTGMTGMDWFAVSMVLSFQLFGGAYTMSYIQQDLLSARKWRIYSLPYPVYKHAYTRINPQTLDTREQSLTYSSHSFSFHLVSG